MAEREQNDDYQNENNYYLDNEVIEEDRMEDRIESIHFQEQKRKKCRSEDYLFRIDKEEGLQSNNEIPVFYDFFKAYYIYMHISCMSIFFIWFLLFFLL